MATTRSVLQRAPGRRPPPRRRRWPARLLVGLIMLGVLIVVGSIIAGYVMSNQVLEPNYGVVYDTEVKEVGDGRITLERDDFSDRPGIYGLVAPDGHGVIGRILSESDDSVTRTLRDVRGQVRKGDKTFIDADLYPRNATPRTAQGIRFRTVNVQTPLGAAPAWFVPGRSRTWAIFVHGFGEGPLEGLRDLPTLRRLGLPVLLIRYRNDPGAPKAPGGLARMGGTEWEDLQSAVDYALQSGARRLVLLGSSMGGAIVSQFLRKSPERRFVTGAVLDAPALDWKRTIEFNAGEEGVPFFVTDAGEYWVQQRSGIDFSDVDQLEHARELRVPILLFHGTADRKVPFETSVELKQMLPRRVTFHPVPGAPHVGSWNVDPGLYQRRLTAFLRRIGAVGTPPRATARGSAAR